MKKVKTIWITYPLAFVVGAIYARSIYGVPLSFSQVFIPILVIGFILGLLTTVIQIWRGI